MAVTRISKNTFSTFKKEKKKEMFTFGHGAVLALTTCLGVIGGASLGLLVVTEQSGYVNKDKKQLLASGICGGSFGGLFGIAIGFDLLSSQSKLW